MQSDMRRTLMLVMTCLVEHNNLTSERVHVDTYRESDVHGFWFIRTAATKQ